VAFVAVRVTV
jgi:hypothetical protein